MGQPWSTISRASLNRARGVSAALAWDTKTSRVVERFLDSSTPPPEVFAFQAHSDRVVTRSRPTCPISTASPSCGVVLRRPRGLGPAVGRQVVELVLDRPSPQVRAVEALALDVDVR